MGGVGSSNGSGTTADACTTCTRREEGKEGGRGAIRHASAPSTPGLHLLPGLSLPPPSAPFPHPAPTPPLTHTCRQHPQPRQPPRPAHNVAKHSGHHCQQAPVDASKSARMQTLIPAMRLLLAAARIRHLPAASGHDQRANSQPVPAPTEQRLNHQDACEPADPDAGRHVSIPASDRHAARQSQIQGPGCVLACMGRGQLPDTRGRARLCSPAVNEHPDEHVDDAP